MPELIHAGPIPTAPGPTLAGAAWSRPALDPERFLSDGFALRDQLAAYLQITPQTLEQRLPASCSDLAALHPGAVDFDPQRATAFYEETVGTAHLLELAAWHLGSAGYIADTLRLQAGQASGQVLDFGGGIGSHALAAASLAEVEQVWFVDLNPHNRAFVAQRAQAFGLSERLRVCRDLGDQALPARFDTVICLDVLEHLPDPAAQLNEFAARMNPRALALMNWYFFKGHQGEYPFHFDEPALVEAFFETLQSRFLEVFHPLLITTRAYRLRR
ncbi:methyltransferase family protein [Synechococcus sp. Ace-Pa]|nr:methyltransferase family protein [Synechococcus sp. Ace-Pa]